MNDELKAYFKTIDKKLISCSRAKRKKCLSIHRGNIEAYFEENPDATIKDIEAYFGSPEKIAEFFLQSSEFSETESRLGVNKKIIRLISIITVILFIVAAIVSTIYVFEGYRYSHGHAVYSSAQEGTYDTPPDAVQTY